MERNCSRLAIKLPAPEGEGFTVGQSRLKAYASPIVYYCVERPKSFSHRHCERSEAIRNTVNHWIASGCALAMTDTDPFEAPYTFQSFA
jgi:hypothetical protein